MSEQQLFVSLGHNSSAAFAVEGSVVRAYEQERLDRIKSSSAYPMQAIELALGHAARADVAYVSHWFDDKSLKPNKYLDIDHLSSVADEIVTLDEHFTHHDAHASSAASFFLHNGGLFSKALIFVLDGFGSDRECFSVYKANGSNRPGMVHRTFGYDLSLGLMYQYATDYLGLRMNQDEYKLLGYESKIVQLASRARVMEIRSRIAEQAEDHAIRMLGSRNRPGITDKLIDYDALKRAHSLWTDRFNQWRDWFGFRDPFSVKVAIAFCAQTFLEFCVLRLIDNAVAWTRGNDDESITQIILAGGCFYNVKLNRRIHEENPRMNVFSHPLAGDQGAAFGLNPSVKMIGLCYGERVIGERQSLPIGVEFCDEDGWAIRAAELIARDRIVNVVRGDMEYGPRALCNTSTLALPTAENVRRINRLNERDEFMPMAPVCTSAAAARLFDANDLVSIGNSQRYMITTVCLTREPDSEIMGVVHPDPIDGSWTARPQVVTDMSPIYQLLRRTPEHVLINTSFNYHGEPIVFTEDDACRTHSMQAMRAQIYGMDPPVTLLVRT
jgi:carbamoyltransferase